MLGNWNRLREPRIGIMLHYDGGASDIGGIYFLTKDPGCKVSYNWAITDDGKEVIVAPENARAWHGGNCTPSDPRLTYRDANSAFYGVAITAGPNDTVTQAQLEAVVRRCAILFDKHKWDRTDGYRIVTHKSETKLPTPPASPPKYRKVDCEGVRKDGIKVLDPAMVRSLVATWSAS